jgi:predicted secreted hydrolase
MIRKGISITLSCMVLLQCLPFRQADATDVPAFTKDGFRVPQPGGKLSFPRDHASHPDYKIEWWYLTGHLLSDAGERFGYQATFFRNALEVNGKGSDGPFGNSQLYLTHMAFTDTVNGTFYSEQRLSRGGWDAYADTQSVDVRNGNWSFTGTGPEASSFLLQAGINSDVTWSLQLTPRKPLLRFGKDGPSRKGPAPEARSYYLTFSRLASSGTVSIGDRTYNVEGESWMDHEIASQQLDPGYDGWDWIAIHLFDGWEIKAYLLRQADGSPSPFSALIWISPEGETFYRNKDAFRWDKEKHWKSPKTDASYPNQPIIETMHPMTGEPVLFQFKPLLENQELVFPGATYWEGAGRILDGSGHETGSAYLELVGYAGAIEGLR